MNRTLARVDYRVPKGFCLLLALLMCLDSHSLAQQTLWHIQGKQLRNHLLTVPVVINGSGPYDFVVDTGSSVTVLDEHLYEALGLRTINLQRLSGIMPQRKERRAVVNEVSVQGACVHDVAVVSMDLVIPFSGRRTDGILGENFLDRFDVLLDNKAKTLWLDRGDDLEKRLTGERIAFSSSSHIRSESFLHRPNLLLTIPSYSTKPVSMILDSAAETVTLFPEATGRDASRFPDRVTSTSITVFGGTLRCAEWPGAVLWSPEQGRTSQIVVCPRVVGERLDAEGNLPSVIFSGVFIAHREGFIIFDPSGSP